MPAHDDPPPDQPRVGLAFTITRLGPRPAPRRLARYLAAGLTVAALAGAGAVLLWRPAGHAIPGGAAARSPGSGNSPAPGAAARPAPATPRGPSRPTTGRTTAPPAAAGPEVAGIGCPNGPGAGVNLAAATMGPGWATAGGGWRGNGCDGSTVWTMDPNGNLTAPSALTWFFSPGTGASHCTLAVFVPAQNALGRGEYAISAGSASLGTVSVDQSASPGQWVTLGSYPARGGPLRILFMPAVATLTGSGPAAGGHGRGHALGSAAAAGHPAAGHNAAVAASAASAACTR
jgi:hypothetical protein